MRYIRMITRYEDKEYVLDEKLERINPEEATPEEMAAFEAHERDATKVHCIMLATMNLELQKSYEDMYPYEMHKICWTGTTRARGKSAMRSSPT
ncbi:unnamed protein product [Lactuca virosa]|uniref:Uncharacterized protein n=1 Tax=Lactuca virosa TaxID=75947 RepID=A0AAU9PXK0_9ASTR|nr:unnamed protein product [Lactuca virosa]